MDPEGLSEPRRLVEARRHAVPELEAGAGRVVVSTALAPGRGLLRRAGTWRPEPILVALTHRNREPVRAGPECDGRRERDLIVRVGSSRKDLRALNEQRAGEVWLKTPIRVEARAESPRTSEGVHPHGDERADVELVHRPRLTGRHDEVISRLCREVGDVKALGRRDPVVDRVAVLVVEDATARREGWRGA